MLLDWIPRLQGTRVAALLVVDNGYGMLNKQHPSSGQYLRDFYALYLRNCRIRLLYATHLHESKESFTSFCLQSHNYKFFNKPYTASYIAKSGQEPVSMSSTTHFDFAVYLSTLHPMTYNIEHLHGGRVNATVRVTPLHEGSDDSETNPAAPSKPTWLAHSFIAKHAPSLLRYPGPELPFSPVRLAIEARALELFSGSNSQNEALLPSSALHLLREHPQIVVPELLHYSPEQHVLLQTDLGNLVPVADWLFASPLPTSADAACLGAALGRFLGTLHAATWALPPSAVDGLRAHFSNPDADAVLFEATVRPLRRMLEACGVPDAESLSAALNETWLRFDADKDRLPGDRLVFSHGDMWHTNVFIVPAESRLPKVAVIDWEFAGMGRLGLDIARFTAYLFLFSKSSQIGPEAKEILGDFSLGLIRAFKHAFPEIALRFAKESFSMLYGLHICNGASWLPWCDCAAVAGTANIGSDRQSVPCAHTSQLVNIGASWLRYGLDSGTPQPSMTEHPVRLLFEDASEAEAESSKRRCCDWSKIFA